MTINDKTLSFLQVLKEKNVRTWIRWVVVPNFNDSIEYAERIALFVKQYSNVELVEILPYHQSGVYKWKELGLPYQLENVAEPTKENIKQLAEVLKNNNVKTLYAK